MVLSATLQTVSRGQQTSDTLKYYLTEIGAKRAISMHLELIQVKALLEVSNAQIWHLERAVKLLQMQVNLLEHNATISSRTPFKIRLTNFINKAGAKILVYAILLGSGIMLILSYNSGFT